MATNPSILAENVGRITAPDADYTYGSAKDDTTGTTGDGTPIKEAILNDTYGFQQALLRAAGIVPSGNADTQLISQYLQGVIQEAMGRAINFDESGIADAYILDVRTNQQGPGVVFEGMQMQFPAGNVNTGASTVDISDLLGEAPGTTVINIKLAGGTVDPSAGDIAATGDTQLVYRTSPSVHAELDKSGVPNLVLFTTSGSYSKPAGLKKIEVIAVGAGGGGEEGSVGPIRGAGGGAGGVAMSILAASALTASETVTIGAGGAGGVGANSAGTSGGSTSFGTLLVSTGGQGGGIPGVGLGGVGGAGTSGQYVTNQSPGSDAADAAGGGSSGDGGVSAYGGKGKSRGSAATGAGAVGFGGGAGGGAGAVAAGGAGFAGVVIIKEFF